MKTRSIFVGVVVAVFALQGCGVGSDSGAQTVLQDVSSTSNCTFTQGFWKNHPGDWPVTSVTLGAVTYSQAQLLAIFGQPVKGNGLVALAHQLIAAKLNVAQGADHSSISGAITAADVLIGSLVVPPVGGGWLAPRAASELTGALDGYNSGKTGPGHCGDRPPPPPPPCCGDGHLDPGETCDDGNVYDADGCSSTCQLEPPPPPPCCGDGHVDPGETCDDGNVVSHDGCSSTCQLEPVCR